ncbi:MAG: thiamine phosphate synthase [Alphaproteobacteria bacterium]|nr:thiamine phosphate synthase [Alphaproteobacteria bacterium]
MIRCRLYLITPPKLDASFAETLKRALDGGDVASLQLRLKGVTDDEVLRAGEGLMRIAQARGVAFIVNDRPDLAKKLGADGVHVGQEDASYGEARALLGPDAIVGVTCHDSRHLAIEAAEAGADYVAFGAFFTTSTKDAKTRAEVELLSWWQEMMTVPCVAIGGITVENAGPLAQAGADFLAVASGVWDYADGPQAAVRRFNDLFDSLAKVPRPAH